MKINFNFKIAAALVLSVMLTIPSVFSAYAGENGDVLYDMTVKYEAYAQSTVSSIDIDKYEKYSDIADYIAQQVSNYEAEVDLRAYKITEDDIRDVFSVFTFRYPEIIHISIHFSYGKSNDDEDIVTKLIPKYLEPSYYDYDLFYAELESLTEQAEKLPDDLSKVLFVHDYIAANTEYASDHSDTSSASAMRYTAYGCLVNGYSVCEGYSLAFKAIMDRLGINCGYAQSDEMLHMWNVVEVNGETYHIDITYDDTVNVSSFAGKAGHINFLCTDEEIAANNHYGWASTIEVTGTGISDRFWDNVDSKVCFSGDYMYYTVYDLDIRSSYIVKKSISTGETEKIYSKLNGLHWFVIGKDATFYTSCYSRIEIIGDTLYYSVPNGVNSIKLDGTDDTVLYTIDNVDEVRVYGFAIKDGSFYISTAQGPTDSDNVKTFKILIDGDGGATSATEPTTAIEPSESTAPAATEPTAATEPDESTEPSATEPSAATEPTEEQPSDPDTTEPGGAVNYIIGDVNHDGSIDISDVTYLQKYLAKYADAVIDTDDEIEFLIADFNSDKNIDIGDATAIQKFLAGYETY